MVLPATRRLAGWGLIALFVAIFPANINMAVHHVRLGGRGLHLGALGATAPAGRADGVGVLVQPASEGPCLAAGALTTPTVKAVESWDH